MTTRRRPKPSGRRNDTEELILQVGQMPFSNGCLESPNTGHRPSTIADEAEPMRTRPSDEWKEHDIKEASADCPSEDEQHMSQVERPLIHNTAVIPEAQGQQNEINRDNTTILKTIEKQEKAREEETKLQHNIEQIMKECSGLREEEKMLQDNIEQLMKECSGLREEEKMLQTNIEQMMKECSGLREKEKLLQNNIRQLKEECTDWREKENEIKQLKKECNGLRKCNQERTFALSRKQSDLDKNRTELQSLQKTIEFNNKCLREYNVAIRTNEEDVFDLKHKNSTLEENMSDLNHENLQMHEEVDQQLKRHHKQEETIQKLNEEKSRKDETIQKLIKEKSRLCLVCLLICIAIAVFLGFNTTQLSTECPDRKCNISIQGNTFISGQ
ncbi:golgin subfamily A member 6-like protein 22 isoform X2 [Mya arenaria]|uniref:golgin subfamily A member 6-like protein 22 isoform X2 n=1 Tax=Mya arenaria TaxID=6604 RepID=UPI0022E3F177|nr:golgin subfamily A member 6-like protein 22 isoform X2 [Mya arenaria]